MNEYVILVDERDREVGTEEKLEAHRLGLLHRAISVFLFHPDGRLLLQQRHPDKYHSGGLWSNTCCSHPHPGEDTTEAASRRLREEMGIDCSLRPAFSFVYRVRFSDTLFEHEYDHVFTGRYAGDPQPDPQEIVSWKWVEPAELNADVAARPERYTHWFRLILPRLLEGASS